MAINPAAFRPDTPLPDVREALADRRLNGAQRDFAAAVLTGDAAAARALVERDPRLLTEPRAGAERLVEYAIATDDPWLVDAVIAAGGLLDGGGEAEPLVLSLFALDPRTTAALLAGGAATAPAGNPLVVFRAAIAIGDVERVDLLLRYGADIATTDEIGGQPLHIALDMERFPIAELLIDRGADLWAIDGTGCNLGTAVTAPLTTPDRADAAAQDRLSQRALQAGWPDPVLSVAALRQAALDGAWPPWHARAAGARPVHPAALATIAEHARRRTTVQ